MKSLLTFALVLSSLAVLSGCSSAPIARDSADCNNASEYHVSHASDVCEYKTTLPER